ncbi:hypothetical protein SDC9_147383 [bioreactor metagenome]|uniref:Uncharacterized protein n=1 Tax=bioreactor metagenome TaxID=1076179 RepID=A0A645EGC7_9ZZZZ
MDIGIDRGIDAVAAGAQLVFNIASVLLRILKLALFKQTGHHVVYRVLDEVRHVVHLRGC